MVSSVLAQAILSQDAPDILGAFQEGQRTVREEKTRELAGKALSGGGIDPLLTELNPEVAFAIGEQIRARNAQDISDFLRDSQIAKSKLDAGDVQGTLQFAIQRRNAIRQRGGDTSQTDDFIQMLSQDPEMARQSLGALLGAAEQTKQPAGVMEFEALTEGLTPEETLQARRIRLGLEARAGITPEEFGQREREKLIAQRDIAPEVAGLKETAKGQAALSTKIVDKSFATIGSTLKNISNIDRAISALDRGAKTGAIQRFLPNISAASVELDQLRNELGLDVIGAVTFGALSEGELNLALDTALPTGLNEAELRDWLVRKKEAQSKTASNLREAVSFLSRPGATVAQFIESKRPAQASPQAEVSPQAQAPAQTPQAQDFGAATGFTEGQTAVNPSTGQTIVVRDGRWVSQ